MRLHFYGVAQGPGQRHRTALMLGVRRQMDGAHLEKGQALIVIGAGDDVATALRELLPGEHAVYRMGATTQSIEILERIAFGHKVALRDIPAGSEVHKYGAVIGRAIADVRAGTHMHVHNLAGVRGRGDLAAGGAKGGEIHAPQG